MKTTLRRSQPRLGKPRVPKASGFSGSIAKVIRDTAREFECSESWVIATLVHEGLEDREHLSYKNRKGRRVEK